MSRNIHLVRHGRSAHVQSGWLDRQQFLRWREAYETAGIATDERPPAELKQLAAKCAVIVSSPAARARDSAMLLDGERDPITSALIAERDLAPPNISIRMPLLAWALTIGIRARTASTAERERATRAAEWLSGLAEQHPSVMAVTHGSFRSLLARHLIATGWTCGAARSSRHWSVWSLSRL